MVINRKLADSFIELYTSFLLFAYEKCDDKNNNEELLKKLTVGRKFYINNREIIDTFFEESNKKVSALYDSIRSLEVSNWIYLRDTTKYSLFVKADEASSYAVLGLTQPIKEIFGSSGIHMKTGIIKLGSAYVCDGLIEKHVYLGKNYRDQFNAVYKVTKENGEFYKQANV